MRGVLCGGESAVEVVGEGVEFGGAVSYEGGAVHEGEPLRFEGG